MGSSLWDLFVSLGIDTKDFTAGIDGAVNKSKSAGSSIVGNLSNIGGGIVLGGLAAAGAGVVALGGFLTMSVKAAGEAQNIMAQVEGVLANTGKTTGVTAKQLEGLGTAFSLVTKFEDDNIVAAGGVLARFDKISKDTMPAAMQATLDLATSLGIDLASAATMVGKVLQTPGEGMLRLKTAGVALTDEQTKLIQSMYDAGDVAGAQDMILKALSGTMGGVAQAAGMTLSGKMEILKNQFGNVQETIGGALLPTLTGLATTMSEKLADPAVQAWIAQFAAGIATLAQNAITLIPKAIQTFKNIFDFLTAHKEIIVGVLAAMTVAVIAFGVSTLIAMGPISPILLVAVGIMALVGVAAALLYKAWETNFGGIRKIVGLVTVWIRVHISAFLFRIHAWWAEHGEKIKATVQAMWDKVMGIFNWFKDQFNLIFQAFQDAFSGNWTGFGEKLRKVWDNAWQAIKNLASGVWDWFKMEIPILIQKIIDFFTKTDWGQIGTDIIHGIGNGITAALSWLKDAASNAAKAALDAAKGFLGIHSPSTVFMGVGKNMMLGMAVGIEQASSIPEKASMQAVSNTVSQVTNITVNPHYYRGDEPRLLTELNMIGAFARAQ